MAQRNREFELKLSLPPDEFDGLVANPRLMGNGGEPSQKVLRSIYYDTPDLRLRNEGLTLRVRHDGERYVQTIKAETQLRNGLSNPIEVEDPVEGSKPDFDRISDNRIRRKLHKTVQSSALTPVFETAISRTNYRLRRRGSLIELALDKGEAWAKTRRSEICEAELELLEGNPKHLLETAQALFSKTNVYPSSISEAERGYSLLLKTGSSGKIEPAYAKKPNVKPGQTCGQAFAEMLRSAGEQIIKNRLVVLKTDEAEGAHQMRVGLTRLRSALRALKPLIASPLLLKLEADAQKISRAVGELRDADVLIEDIYAPVARKFPVTPGFDQLYQTLQSHRSTMQQKARQSLSSENWSGLLLGISLWPALLEREAVLKQPIEKYAQKIFEKRWKQAAKYGRSLNKLALEERHAMRRSLKKLRYTSEFLAPLYDDKAVKPFIGRLKKLQDVFGYVNDVRLARPAPHHLRGAVRR